ncbi:O-GLUCOSYLTRANSFERASE RUMI-like protein [Salix koriyanagi]|uniref:O-GLUCOSYLTRANSFERASE RUMI-like protein n=1 Tax=Salix koriyanagi TaxID=2511006 RepID=A0A9Q0TEE2_9ROSI|nr:O-GLUCOSYLTRANSFERASE RUMI-like protein [Salix koriyanagi]
MWKSTGISRAMVERAKDYAHFRLVILKGKMYVEKYKKSFHTRDVFTIWGISQLLRLYPGKVPDLELMFWCEDRPVILKKDYQGTNATSSPSIFQYCGHEDALGIVFPDWTFWGVDWRAESEQGYEHSKLEDQCTHRYKIYIEGRGWSVSDKYILACDSMTLFVKPEYYDFFIRSMVPLQHYWPVSARNKCRDIKFAVEWGNSHTDKVSMARPRRGLWKEFMAETQVNFPSNTLPCTMPPPYESRTLEAFNERKENVIRQVEKWEKEIREKIIIKKQQVLHF